MRCHKLCVEVPGFIPTPKALQTQPFIRVEFLNNGVWLFHSLDGRPVPEIIEPWHLTV
jgi:hypothetical protein